MTTKRTEIVWSKYKLRMGLRAKCPQKPLCSRSIMFPKGRSMVGTPAGLLVVSCFALALTTAVFYDPTLIIK